MKNNIQGLLFFLFSLSIISLSAQEKLSPLKYNKGVRHSTSKVNAQQHQPASRANVLLVDKGIFVTSTDVITIPFVDDFSTRRLPDYRWRENHITQTYYNVFGSCLVNMGIATQQVPYIQDTAYNYTFNDSTFSTDSTPITPTAYVFFGPSTTDCFTQTPDTFYYWPPFTRYHFDSSGIPVDSVVVNDTLPNSLYHVDTLNLAPVVYFTSAEPGALWFDNYAYFNNTYPVNPPTIGVATLDGLDEFGQPYNKINTNTQGPADYLTSKPFDLSGIAQDDSTLYISFFFEPQGLGDFPDLEDSLLLEIKDQGGSWNTLWAHPGYSSSDSFPNQFQQVIVQIPPYLQYIGKDSTKRVDSVINQIDSFVLQTVHYVVPIYFDNYFHNIFQFRFRNDASLYGANDHWHIDYVKFDRNRSYKDTVIHDIAFQYDFPTILKNYTQLPANLFAGNSDLTDSISLPVHNLDPNANQNAPATNFLTGAAELYPNQAIVATSAVQTFNAAQYSTIQIDPFANYTIVSNNPAWPVDSLVITSIATIEPNDSRATNDTSAHLQNFGHIMAYDDGSAEAAYGITGLGINKFAYEFDLPAPDTLAGFQIMFDQVSDNVDDLVFNFYAWDSLRFNDYSFVDSPTIELDNKLPLYIDSVNGFATYVFDSSYIISGKIYIGWGQNDPRSLQVGYDLNSTLGRQHMFIFTNGTWKPSEISPDGSPMIRLILDGNYHGLGTPVTDLRKDKNDIAIFPNPATGRLNLRTDNGNAVLQVTITNMMGQQVEQVNNVRGYMDVSGLASGMYLLSATDTQSGKTYHTKVIKASF